jgi:hypothetical protein
METWALFMCVVFGFSLIILGLMYRWGGRLFKIIAALFLGVLLYHAQWYARALWDVRLIDDAYSREMQDKLISAILRGERNISLSTLTPFQWNYVCELQNYDDYSDNKELAKIFHHHLLDITRDRDPWSDNSYLVFAIPQGYYKLEPFGWRFSYEFQTRWNGRFYKEQLQEKSYDIELVLEKKSELKTQHLLCFKPDEAWIIIRNQE